MCARPSARTIRLDLASPAGQDVLRDLVRNADVLVQNLSPGAMDRFGLGYDELSQVNPGLIMASGTGFGSFGPYAGELIAEAVAAMAFGAAAEDIGMICHAHPSLSEAMKDAALAVDKRALNI